MEGVGRVCGGCVSESEGVCVRVCGGCVRVWRVCGGCVRVCEGV